MNIRYNKADDVLYLAFSDEPVAESDESQPGVILDYSREGRIVGIEVLRASQQIGEQVNVLSGAL